MGHFFGERQGLAHQPADPLPQRIIESFQVRRLSTLLAHTAMGFLGPHGGVGFPEIAVGVTPLVCRGQRPPQPSTGGFTMVAPDKGYDLTSPATQRHPQPNFVDPEPYERPQFIQFEHITRLCRLQGLLERRKGLGFF